MDSEQQEKQNQQLNTEQFQNSDIVVLGSQNSTQMYSEDIYDINSQQMLDTTPAAYTDFIYIRPGQKVATTSTQKSGQFTQITTENLNYKNFLRIDPGERYPLTSTQNRQSHSLDEENVPHNHQTKRKRTEEIVTDADILHKIYNTQKEILHRVCNIEDEIKQIKSDVELLKKLQNNTVWNVLPSSPFDDIEEFMEFEKSLLYETDKVELLTQDFIRTGGDTPFQFIKSNIRKIMTDKIAQNFSWAGTPEKRSIQQFKTIAALKHACLKVKDTTQSSVDKIIMRHFQYSKQRNITQKKMKKNQIRIKKFS